VVVAGVREAGVGEAGVVAEMRVVGVVKRVGMAVLVQMEMRDVGGARAVEVVGVGVGVGVVVVVVVVVEVEARGSARAAHNRSDSDQEARCSCTGPGAIPSVQAEGLLLASKNDGAGTSAPHF
jgi:hypothetical protein